MTDKELISKLRTVPDFPVKGILFWDVTTLFKDPDALKDVTDKIYDIYKDKGITKVVGVESRGFIIGSTVALKMNAGFVPIRKPGKLPAETYQQTYMKEYGTDTIEIHKDAITSDDVVLLHDDLLATGGSAAAAISLIQKSSPKAIYANFIIELDGLGGRKALPSDIETTSILLLDEKSPA